VVSIPTATTSNPAPAAPAPVTVSNPAPAAPAPVTVQVYVNGQQINSTVSTSTSGTGSLDEAVFAQLLEAMSAWPAATSSESIFGGTQVQIWNA
jgi:hypothetical protein